MADDLPEDWDDNPEWDDTNSAPLDIEDMLVVARAKLGLTRQEAADLLGIDLETLCGWEERRTEPDRPARTLIRLFYDHPHEIRAWLIAA